MVSLTKYEKEKLKEILISSKDKEAGKILNKIKNEKKLKYIDDKKEIQILLMRPFFTFNLAFSSFNLK